MDWLELGEISIPVSPVTLPPNSPLAFRDTCLLPAFCLRFQSEATVNLTQVLLVNKILEAPGLFPHTLSSTLLPKPGKLGSEYFLGRSLCFNDVIFQGSYVFLYIHINAAFSDRFDMELCLPVLCI